MTSPLSLSSKIESLPLHSPFRISGYTFTSVEVIVATLSDGEVEGRGEASGVYYMGDDPEGIAATLERLRPEIEAGVSRDALRQLLPAGGARNALDCALWDLEAKQSGRPVWQLAGLEPPRPLITTFTVGADDPAAMAEGARRHAQARSLKLKLTGDLDLDLERVRAVRAARPDTWIGVDGNQGFSIDVLQRLVEGLVEAGVSLLEQPLKRGCEADLEGINSPIPIAADESALELSDVEGLVGRFDVLNIKLDKCGGLTEALLMAEAARRHGLQVMVGCMASSSLAMAPGFVVGQLCDLVDLDGPTFLAGDRETKVVFQDGRIWCPPELWGSPQALVA
jgi:L-alanine-DL-glutamate epimerase-like enolase superfamily enzyme